MMKTINYFKSAIKTSVSVLCAAFLALNLCSCDVHVQEFVNEMSDDIKTEGQKLEGVWYAMYDVNGSIKVNETLTVECKRIVEVYNMESPTKGHWTRFYFEEDLTTPIAMLGGLKEGQYTYMALKGTGAIYLTNKTEKLSSWNFTYDEKTLTAKGALDRDITFSKALQEQTDRFFAWYNKYTK